MARVVYTTGYSDEEGSYSDEDRHDYSLLVAEEEDEGALLGTGPRASFSRAPDTSVEDAEALLAGSGLVYTPDPDAAPPGPWALISPPEPPPKPRYERTYTEEDGWVTRLLPRDQWIPADPRKVKYATAPPPYGKNAQCVRDFVASTREDLYGDEGASSSSRRRAGSGGEDDMDQEEDGSEDEAERDAAAMARFVSRPGFGTLPSDGVGAPIPPQSSRGPGEPGG